VRAHLTALGCARYEIAVHDGDTGRVRQAVLTADEAMLQISRLVVLNGQGDAITVRPATGLASGLVVLDDLDAVGLRRLRDEGHVPVIVTGTTGTTDGRYQVWLRLSTDELDPPVAAQAAHDLQQRYGPAQGRDLAHVGPLAGFVDYGAQGDHTGARGARGKRRRGHVPSHGAGCGRRAGPGDAGGIAGAGRSRGARRRAAGG